MSLPKRHNFSAQRTSRRGGQDRMDDTVARVLRSARLRGFRPARPKPSIPASRGRDRDRRLHRGRRRPARPPGRIRSSHFTKGRSSSPARSVRRSAPIARLRFTWRSARSDISRVWSDARWPSMRVARAPHSSEASSTSCCRASRSVVVARFRSPSSRHPARRPPE